MTFAQLVLKNLMRQRVRSLLTLLGIMIGITTVVALGAVTAGLKSTAGAFVRSGNADFMVAQEGASDLSFSRLPEGVVADVAGVPGVEAVRGVLIEIIKAGSNPFFFLGGVRPADLAADPPDLQRGRLPRAPDEVVLGREAAGDLGVDVGDAVVLGKRRLRVVGVYDSDVVWERNGGFAPLGTVQTIAKKPDTITVAYVLVAPGADPKVVAKRIPRRVDDVVTISSASEYAKIDQGFVLLDGANAAISLLAIVIGGIGVMNTMVMSVFERTREIGILRAVGWTGRRVLRMILLESLALTTLAAALGSLVGVAASKLVTRIPAARGFIVPAYPTRVFVQAFVVGIVVGLAGAIYPAVRATRLTPMEALRYE